MTPVYKWLKNSLRILPDKDSLRQVTADLLATSDRDKAGHRAFEKLILAFLHDADLGIIGIDVKRREVHESDIPDNIGISDRMKGELLHLIREKHPFDVTMSHRNADTDEDVRFRLEDESDGTQRFFELMGPWVLAIGGGFSVFVDELESSLHPLLTRELIKFFQNDVNEKGAQLIFTTHDTTLLDPELFRRDQIWFAEKDEKDASQLYSMNDYKVRKGEAMQKAIWLEGMAQFRFWAGLI